MNEVQWPRARESVWRVRIAAITVTLAAFGFGATWKHTFDIREGRGDIRLALQIAEDEGAAAETRLLAMTAMRRDVLAALRAFDRLKSDPMLGPHATRFADVGDR